MKKHKKETHKELPVQEEGRICSICKSQPVTLLWLNEPCCDSCFKEQWLASKKEVKI